MPEISTIVPVYNRPQLLREAVESVFAQSFADFELIIVDDGSTDDTPAAAAELASSEEASGRCRVITTPRSGFPGAVRNRGAEASSGRYLAFLDSDDLWAPEKLARQYAFMRENGGPVSHTRELWLRGEKIVSQKGQKHIREGNIFADALKKCIIGPSTVMIERDFYFQTGGFSENLEIAEDYEYWLRITCGYPVGYVNEMLTHKRAGSWPQLSEKYGKIEWFRLCALASLLGVEIPGCEGPGGKAASLYLPGYRWTGFSEENLAAATEELILKCSVWAAGCRKRKRYSEAEQFNDIIRACKTK